jgi:hypothetical protein
LRALQVRKDHDAIAGIDDLLDGEGLVRLARGALFHGEQERLAVAGEIRVVMRERVRDMARVRCAHVAGRRHAQELGGNPGVALAVHDRSPVKARF